MKINIGCGPNYLEGWVNTDLVTTHNFTPDQLWDFRLPTPLPDGSVDFVLAWHILEHAGLHERDGMVRDWFRVLKPGGKLAIAVPNIQIIFENWQKKLPGYDNWFNVMVNIFGPFNGFEGDYHRWGYNQEELWKVLTEAGFSRIEVLWFDNVPKEIVEFTKGKDEERKVVFAEWAVQFLCIK